jgi:hypothetical protein
MFELVKKDWKRIDTLERRKLDNSHACLSPVEF